MKELSFRTICGFCHTNCGMIVHLKEGKIHRVEGDPDNPVNRGYLCAKGYGARQLVYAEDRLLHPMRKTRSGFKKVSWNEAVTFAADKLQEIREKHGANSIARYIGAPTTYECRDGFMQFMGSFGSGNFTSSGTLCFYPRVTGLLNVFGGRPEPDYDASKLIIFWSSNPMNTCRFGLYSAYDGFDKIIDRARDRGAMIVVVDPVRSEMAKLADEWIDLNIGTDAALGLAMLNVIVSEGLYDKAFAEKWISGFDKFKEHVKPMTPEWAEPITGLSASRIRDFARLYATTKPAIIHEGNGFDMQTNSVDCGRIIAMLISITENIDAEGGNALYPIVPQSPLPVVKPPKTKLYDQYPIFPEIPWPVVSRSILEGAPDRPRALIVQHGNPAVIQANEKKTREALSKLDFLLVVDIFMTATAELADLVLPAASDFERYDYRAVASRAGSFVALRRKIIEPLGESRSVFDVEYEIAKRMEIEKDYPFTNNEEWLNYMLKPSKINLEDLKEKQIIYVTPPAKYKKYLESGFNTKSKKIEFYSERFKAIGYEPMPVYREPGESFLTHGHLESAYPLQGTSRKPASFVHSRFRNLPMFQKMQPHPLMRIHPDDAEKRDIKDMAWATIRSPRGEMRALAKLTYDTKPGLVVVDFGWGNPYDMELSNINSLTSDELFDPLCGGTPNRMFLCEVAPSE